MLESVRENEVLATFAIILIGSVAGSVRVGRVALGTSAVLLVAMVFGHFRMVDPASLQPFGQAGIALFAYAVGLQAGPRIASTLRGAGRSLVPVALATILGTAVCATALGSALGLSAPLVIGVFAGAMTSTPGLAAATEVSGDPLVSVGYGVAYPIGVVAVVLFVQFLPRRLAAHAPESKRHTEVGDAPAVSSRCFRVDNPAVAGKTFAGLALRQLADVNVSRVLRGDEVIPAGRDVTLSLGDVLMAVGTGPQLARLEVVFGPAVEVEAERLAGRVIARDVFVTAKAVIGKSLSELALRDHHGIVITRVRREAIEFVPKGNFVLELGDQVRAVGPEPEVLAFAQRAGIHERRVHETGITAFALGLVLGLVVGLVSIPLPGVGSTRLGLAGGPMLVGLAFGHFGRIGGVRIHVPLAARYLLRELGLLLFMASAGAAAGTDAVAVLGGKGIGLLILAAATILVALGLAFWLAYGVFRHGTATTMGMTCGTLTSTPGLGIATAQFEGDAPALAYAAVYPIALILVTVVAQAMAQILT